MKNKHLGAIFCIVGPFLLLFFTISAYTIASFVSNMSDGGLGMIMSVVNIVLGISGIVALFGIPIGIPYGIYLLVQNMQEEDAHPEENERTLA